MSCAEGRPLENKVCQTRQLLPLLSNPSGNLAETTMGKASIFRRWGAEIRQSSKGRVSKKLRLSPFKCNCAAEPRLAVVQQELVDVIEKEEEGGDQANGQIRRIPLQQSAAARPAEKVS